MRSRPPRYQRTAAALVSVVVILVVVAAFSGLLLSTHAAQISIDEAGIHRLRAEAAAMAATHLTLWELNNDTDLQKAMARVVYEGDTSFKANPLFKISGDLAGAKFSGEVWPGADTARLKSTGVSGGVYCDRWAQMPLTLGGGQFEVGLVKAGGTRVTVSLSNKYVKPVVVCTMQYRNNTIPVVPRVSNVTSNSFRLRLQNPRDRSVSTEIVSYIVMEAGVWSIGGVNCEAQTYKSTTTDRSTRWVGRQQKYGQSYAKPVVIGQVMTENDADWSVFWCRGKTFADPPSADRIWTGKTVCEDTDTKRDHETVGYIVFETAHGKIGGVEFEAALGRDTICGVQGSPPYAYSFKSSFSSAPQVALGSTAAMDGFNGGWAQVHGATMATASTLFLSIDEDQIRDSERAHTTEQVGYLVFGSSVVYP